MVEPLHIEHAPTLVAPPGRTVRASGARGPGATLGR
jgi:hypothetical protein